MRTGMERWKPLRRLPALASGVLPWPRSTKASHSAKPVSQRPIVVLGALFEEQVSDLVAHRLTPVVSDGADPPRLGQGRSIHIRLPIRSTSRSKPGWGGWGFLRKNCSPSSTTLSLRSPLQVEGMMTHLADADGADSAFTERQLGVFRAMLEQIRQRGLTLPLVHTANSAAIVRFPDAHFSLVRPGIMLYGYHTLPASIPAPDLKPVLSLRTHDRPTADHSTRRNSQLQRDICRNTTDTYRGAADRLCRRL